MVFSSGCLGGNGMSLVETWKGTYHVGDFVEYYVNEIVHESGEHVLGHSILIETIINTTQTEYADRLYVVHVVQIFSDYPSHNVDEDRYYLTDASWAFGKAYDFNGRQSDMALFRYVENVPIETRWGSLLCQYFTNVDTSLGSYDCWVRNGVVVKVEQQWDEITCTLMLNDTNLAEITGD